VWLGFGSQGAIGPPGTIGVSGIKGVQGTPKYYVAFFSFCANISESCWLLIRTCLFHGRCRTAYLSICLYRYVWRKCLTVRALTFLRLFDVMSLVVLVMLTHWSSCEFILLNSDIQCRLLLIKVMLNYCRYTGYTRSAWGAWWIGWR